MNQIIQSLSSGEVINESVPVPSPKQNHLLIATSNSLISAGTERMLLNFGRSNILQKIKQQPDKVKQVLEKIKTDGLLTTLEAVKSKLDQPVSLGYSNVGYVLDNGGASEFKVGDRVLSNGPHAEIVRVPKTLCAKIPDNVSDEEAVFTVVGAIALQGIRLLNPTLGECVVVQGLGLIGLIAVQLLRAQGCSVLGVDYDSHKLALAKQFGAECVDLSKGESLIQKAEYFSRGRGADAVLITASAREDDIVHQAATISRKRGRIVLIGVVDLDLRREDFYEKELSFQVSCSYGPGRYDENYENKGQDYPVAYVRWTEQRNFEAILDVISTGLLNVKPLISNFFSLEDAKVAYDALSDKSNLGVIFEYPEKNDVKKESTISLVSEKKSKLNSSSDHRLAFIGAGNYASRMLMPAFKKTNVTLDTVVTTQGLSAVIQGKKQSFQNASTDYSAVLSNEKIATVVIATQHNLHAKQVIDALQFGKNVFVEKPLCLTKEELHAIKEAYEACKDQILMIGFNRRFSPFTQKIKSLISSENVPVNFVMTVNAGFIPKNHWTQDPCAGGGRLIGEACHFVDLLRYLADSKIQYFNLIGLKKLPVGSPNDENITITLQFENGSAGTVHYFANGHKAIPKERLEVFVGGKVLQLDNFKKLTGYGFSKFKKMRSFRQNKGQDACVAAFTSAIEEKSASPISFEELFEVTEVCISLKSKLDLSTECL